VLIWHDFIVSKCGCDRRWGPQARTQTYLSGHLGERHIKLFSCVGASDHEVCTKFNSHTSKSGTEIWSSNKKLVFLKIPQRHHYTLKTAESRSKFRQIGT
jgi:hypothetical protein